MYMIFTKATLYLVAFLLFSVTFSFLVLIKSCANLYVMLGNKERGVLTKEDIVKGVLINVYSNNV